MGGFMPLSIPPAIAQTSDTVSPAPEDVGAQDAIEGQKREVSEPLLAGSPSVDSGVSDSVDSMNPVFPSGENEGARILLLERLGERQRLLNEQETAIRLRESLLRAAEQRINLRVNDLKDIETRIKTMISKRKEEQNSQLKGLVVMYENMKPKDAARIFSTLDLEVLVSLVDMMNVRKMSNILASMDSLAARKLTVAISNRSQESLLPDSGEDPEERLPEISDMLPDY